MAIYSFNHDTFGKSTARAKGNTPYAAAKNAAYNVRAEATRYAEQDGTAAGNAAYNVRPEVTFAARSHGMPTEPAAVEKWFREQERNDRANARMSDRFIGALPRELSPEQCIDAVESFCRGVTQDRVPWHFGLHLELEDKGKADWNPHAHIIFRDRDVETGKRFLNTTAGQKERRQLAGKGVKAWSTQDFRQAWQAHMNQALERAGHEVRIDARSNKARGIEAEPAIHHGRGAARLVEKGQTPETRQAYRGIDDGTRLDENKRRRRRSERPPPDTPEKRQREALNAKQGQERSDIAAAQHAERLALRTLHAAEFRTRSTQENLHHREQRNAAYADIGAQFKAKYQAVRGLADPQRRQAAIAELGAEQAAAYEARAAKLVANARPAKDARWREMKAVQAAERRDLEEHQKREAEALKLAHVAEREAFAAQQRDARSASSQVSQALRDSVALSGSQRMVNIEAVQMERMRRRAEQAQQERGQQQTGESLEAARRRMSQLRDAGDTMKEATEKRVARQQKQAAKSDDAARPNKQKGKGDQEQER